MRTLVEAVGVVVVGLGLALAANYLSPRGLSLGRDYFPATPTVPPATGSPPPSTGPLPPTPDATNPPASAQSVQARLAARGFRFLDATEARALFNDPRREQELVVFIDARNERHYEEGHVPGAYVFDHYYADRYLPDVMVVCQQAETIVLYCTGGNCEDSEFAAVALKEAGIPAERLAVFVGGMAEWQANGWPVEVGPRGSGVIQESPR